MPEYIYALRVLGADGHLIERRVGLTGFSPMVQRASYRYWTAMAELFTSEGHTKLAADPPTSTA